VSERLSRSKAEKDPAAFLASIRHATPHPLWLGGVPAPLPKGAKRREKVHVSASRVHALQSAGSGEVVAWIDDGTRLVLEKTSLARALDRMEAAGYRYLKSHARYAVRVDRLAGVCIARDPIEVPAKSSREVAPQALDLSRLAIAIEPREDGTEMVSFYDPKDPTTLISGPIEPFKARRYQLRIQGHTEDACPIGPGDTQERVITALAPFTAPPLEKLERPVPESRYPQTVREEGLVTIGGHAFWSLAMNPEATAEEKAAWIQRWTIHNLPLEEALEVFRYAGRPSDAQRPRDWINKERAIKNVIWQVYQWLTWGIIDSIKRGDADGDGELPGDDEDDWWDDPNVPQDPDAKKPNIRTLWYRYGKGALKNWGIYKPGDDGTFQTEIKTLAREKGLFRYRDFGFKDVLRKRRAIGEERPQLLVFTEKQGMEELTQLFAHRVKGSHLILSGEPPKITMEYLTTALVEALLPRGPLAEQEVHVFGLVDYNAAGSNILESVHDDLVHYGRLEDPEGKGFKAVHAHNLLYADDMTDEEILSHRTAQVHFREEWRYVGGKRTKVRHFEAGNPSRFTFVEKWFNEKVKDPRFHEKTVYAGGLIEEVYFGLEVDDHPEDFLKERFKTIVTSHKLLKP